MNTQRQYKTSESERQRANAYYQQNKEKCLKQRKKYYELHRDKIREKFKTQRQSEEYRYKKMAYDAMRYETVKDKRKQQSKEYYVSHKANRKNYLLKKQYGISLEEYIERWRSQKGKCEICSREFLETDIFSKSHSLVVDHNHLTNSPRGLICNSCNRALGLFQDNIGIINSASKYLTKWNSYAPTKRI